MSGLDNLLLLQVIYLVVIFLLLRSARKNGRNIIVYWIILGLYLITLIWLTKSYFERPKVADGGYTFALGMYSMIVPGILVLVAMLSFLVAGRKKKNQLTKRLTQFGRTFASIASSANLNFSFSG